MSESKSGHPCEPSSTPGGAKGTGQSLEARYSGAKSVKFGKNIRLSDLRAFTRAGRLFCMMSAYLDESYGPSTVCVGGWIATDEKWDRIQEEWLTRLNYENRVSAKHGLKKLRRFHAADCSNLVNDFEGWSRGRQIRFVKALLNILIEHKPMAFAFGASFSEFCALFPSDRKKHLIKECFKFCIDRCLKDIGEVMHRHYTHERISVIHDRDGLLPAARIVFDNLMKDDTYKYRRYFVTFAPMSWEDCVPLQPADMIAYDVFKLVGRRIHDFA
jgi:hypothetical protein